MTFYITFSFVFYDRGKISVIIKVLTVKPVFNPSEKFQFIQDMWESALTQSMKVVIRFPIHRQLVWIYFITTL